MRKQPSLLHETRAKAVLKRVKEGGSWPVCAAGEWKALYEEMFGEKLVTGSEAYKKLRKTIDNAKLKHKKQYPDDQLEH